MLIAQRTLADYRLIEYEGTRLLPSDTLAFQETAVAWLDQTLAEPHDGPTVVLTHHAPSPRSIPPFQSEARIIARRTAAKWETSAAEEPSSAEIVGNAWTCLTCLCPPS
jgi:hypothetical protein